MGIKVNKKKIPLILESFQGEESEVTAELIDHIIEDTAKRGIEEMQKDILEEVNFYVKMHQFSIVEAFLKYDVNSTGYVTYKHFKD